MRTEELPLADNSRRVLDQCLKKWRDQALPPVYRDKQASGDFDWVRGNVESIHAVIATLSNPSTRRLHLSSLVTLLKALGMDEHKETSALLDEAVLESDGKLENKMDQAALGKFLPLESLRVRLQELESHLPRSVDTKGKVIDVLVYVLLACYVLQPPLRRDWGDVQIVQQTDVPTAGRAKLHAYKDDWEIELLGDKVMRTKGSVRLPITPELKSAIAKSLDLLPRKYVLCRPGFPEKPLGTGQQFTHLSNKVHPRRKVGANDYRKAWACTLHNKPDQEWHDLAHSMRTSAEKLRSTYFALNSPKAEDEVMGRSVEGYDLVKRVDEQAWAKKHLDEQAAIDEKAFREYRHKENRAVLLRDLKSNKRRPSHKTFTKYGIKWNGTNWY